MLERLNNPEALKELLGPCADFDPPDDYTGGLCAIPINPEALKELLGPCADFDPPDDYTGGLAIPINRCLALWDKGRRLAGTFEIARVSPYHAYAQTQWPLNLKQSLV